MNKAYIPYVKSTARHFGMRGGAGSGKSYACADKCILRALTEPNTTGMVFRKVSRTIKRSVFELLISRLKALDVMDALSEPPNKTDYTFKFKNGSQIWCSGLDDQEKLKSIEGVSWAWLEEATEFTPEDVSQINLRLRGETAGAYFQITYSFNGISVRHHLKKFLFDDPPSDCETLVTTYKDNQYLDDQYIAELEEQANKSENFKAVYVDGGWGSLQGMVYPSGFDYSPWVDAEKLSEPFYGIDFGFNDPCVIVGVQMYDGEAYLTEHVYESGLTTTDLIGIMQSLGIDRNADIYCDAAEPDRIEEIKRAGFRCVKPAYKGAGSLRAGIDYCQSMTLHSLSSNTNMNSEIDAYSWKTNNEGSSRDEPVDANNHAMDAMRYALYTHLGKPASKIFTTDRNLIGF